MKRLLTLFLLLLAGLAGLSLGVRAQPPATASAFAPAPFPAPVPAPVPGVNPADAQRVIDMLNDPKKRADFTATLEAIARSVPPVPTPGATPVAAELALPLVPDSLGAQLLVSGSDLLGEVSNRMRASLDDLRSIPPIAGWLVMMATDPLGRKLLADTGWRLAVTFAAGLAAEWTAWWLLRRSSALLGMGIRWRPRARAGSKTPDETVDAMAAVATDGREIPDAEIQDAEIQDADMTDAGLSENGVSEDGQARAEIGAVEPPERRRSALLARMRLLPGMLLRLLLALVPVVCFVLTAHLVVSTGLGEVYMTRLTLLAMIDAYAVWRIILCCAGAVLSPDAPRWRLLPMATDTAISGVRWIGALSFVCVFGYAIAEAGLLLGMSKATHDALLKADGLIVMVLAIVIVLRNRAAVAGMIRARPGHRGPMVGWRKRLAAFWHILAVFYLVGLWLVWAVDVPDGFRRLLNFFVVTILVIMAARLTRTLLLGLLERQIERRAADPRYPGMTARIGLYHPLLSLLVHVVVSVAALIALMQLWGLGPIQWLATNLLAQRMMSALTVIAVATAVAIGIWELATAGIAQHLSRLQRDAQTARSARLRTLLPMLRTGLLISILVVIGMIVLSEIGVNIAPLLAGAGVLGIAIGFGSQKLVQDVITGLFLLLENTMQVGDVVLLGGLTGVVEHLSIRTIRLRAEDGSVHVIPFSAVTTVTNMTRDFAHAVIEAEIAYKENYDRVVEVLRAIVTQMRSEPRWQNEIRDDLEVMGLQRFAESAVIIKCRIRCGPFGRWMVLREFNRRMKMRFDEEGIEIPFPHQKLILDDRSTQHPLVLAAARGVACGAVTGGSNSAGEPR